MTTIVAVTPFTPPPKSETSNTGASLPPPSVERGYIYRQDAKGGDLGVSGVAGMLPLGCMDPMLGKGVNTGKGWSGWEIK